MGEPPMARKGALVSASWIAMTQPVAIIAGAGRGIGRASAIELAKAGYRPVLASRNLTELQETARLAGIGLAVSTDVSDPAQVEQLVARTLAEFGRIDAIVHCAGLAPVRPIPEMSP